MSEETGDCLRLRMAYDELRCSADVWQSAVEAKYFVRINVRQNSIFIRARDSGDCSSLLNVSVINDNEIQSNCNEVNEHGMK